MNGHVLALAALVSAFAPQSFAAWEILPFRVTDAQFSTALNRIVMISNNPNQLHIYDPATKNDRVISVPEWPLSLSISPDGLFAAVGRPSGISYISLANASVLKNLPTSEPASSVVLANNDYIYIVPDLWVRISTGEEFLGFSGGPDSYFARLHPNGKMIYIAGNVGIQKYDISAGKSRRGGVLQIGSFCSKFQFSPTGHLIGNCGEVIEADTDPDSYDAKLVSPLGLGGEVAIRNGAPIATGNGNRVGFHDVNSYAFLGSAALGDVPAAWGGVASVRFLSYNVDASELTLIANGMTFELDSPSALQTYKIAGRSAACHPVIAMDVNSVAPAGGFLTVNVTAPANCLWRVTANDAAIQADQGGFGVGTQSIQLFVPPSGRGVAKQYTISAAGANSLLLAQGPNTTPNLRSVFPGKIADAALAGASDRIALAVTTPSPFGTGATEGATSFFQIWSTMGGGIVSAIPLPLQPLALSISEDGARAAVGYKAAVSYVDVSAGKVLWTRGIRGGNVRSVVLAGERVYAFAGEHDPARTYVAGTGEELETHPIITADTAKLHPSGKFIYGTRSYDTLKFGIVAGNLELLYRVNKGICKSFSFTAEGDMLFGCGGIYTVRASQSQDLLLLGPLAESAITYSAAHSPQLGAFAVSTIERAQNQEIGLFSASTLRYGGKVALTPFASPIRGSVKHLFFSSDSVRLYSVVQTGDSSSNVPDKYVVETTPMAGVTGNCPITGPQSMTAASTGANVGVNVGAAANCVWRAASSEPWIQVLTDVGIGTGVANLFVAANYSTVARIGKVVVNGVDVSIQQGPGTPTSGPLPGTIEPSSGRFDSQTFVVRLTNTTRFTTAYISFGNSPAAPGSCTIEYSNSTGAFRLLDSAGIWWLPEVSGIAGDNHCVLRNPRRFISGSQIVLSFQVHFHSPLYGSRDVSMITFDAGTSSGWRKRGSYTIGAHTAEPAISVRSLVPESGSGTSQTFQATFSHSGGSSQLYLGYMLFLRTPNIVSYTAKGSCLVEYNRISHGMRLINNAGDDWLGPLVGIRVGTTGAVLSNSQCSIDVGAAKATLVDDRMIVEAPLTFHSASPISMTFLQGFDILGRYTGMTQMGTWVTGLPDPPAPGPAIKNVSRTSVGNTHKFTIAASHTQGTPGLASIHLRFGATITAPESCHVYYIPGENAVNLVSDAGIPAGPNLPLGGAGTASNSRCTVTAAGATRTLSGDTLTVTLPVSFHNPATFDGDRSAFVNAFDASGNLTHWVSAGSVRVQ